MRDNEHENTKSELFDAINTAQTLALALDQALVTLKHVCSDQAGQADADIKKLSNCDEQTVDFVDLQNKSKALSEVDELFRSGVGALTFVKQVLGVSKAKVNAEAKDKSAYLLATSDTMKLGPMTQGQAKKLVEMIQVKASVVDEKGLPVLVSNKYKDEEGMVQLHTVDFAGGQPDVTINFKDGLVLTFDPYKCKPKDIDLIKSQVMASRHGGEVDELLEVIASSCKIQKSGEPELNVPAFMSSCSNLESYAGMTIECVNTASCRELREETECKVAELVDPCEKSVVNEIPTTRGISENKQAVYDASRGVCNGENLSKVVESLTGAIENLTTVTFSKVKGLTRANHGEGEEYKVWGGKNIPVKKSFPKGEKITVCETLLSSRQEVVNTLKIIVNEIKVTRAALDAILKTPQEDRTSEQNSQIERLQNRIEAQLPSLVKSHASDKTLLPEVGKVNDLSLVRPNQAAAPGVFSRLVSGIFSCIDPAKDDVQRLKVKANLEGETNKSVDQTR